MKKQIKAVILGLVFGTVSANAQGVMANKLTAANFTTEKSSSEFSKFVEKKAKKISRKNNIEIAKYNEVVSLYNTTSVGFYNLSDADKTVFVDASNKLTEKLSSSRKKEAKQWAKKISADKAIFEFIWSSKNIAVNDDLVEIPNSSQIFTGL